MSRYFFPIFLILLAFVVYQFYVRPLYAQVERQLAKEIELKTALTEADTAHAQLDKIDKSFKAFPLDATKKLDEIFPETIDPIRLLIDTTAFLQRNGFPPRRLSVSTAFGESKSSGAYQMHNISFAITATYDTFREFLHVLEGSLALRDLTSVSFTAGTSLGNDPSSRPEFAVHEYNILLTSYSLR